MAAPTNTAKREKALAKPEPSTHGTSRHFPAMRSLVATRHSGQNKAASTNLDL
jgi:hypothetical protein